MALEITYGDVGVIPINTVLLQPIEVERGADITLQVSALGTSGNVRVEQSHDGVYWSPVVLRRHGVLSTAPVLAVSAAGMYAGVAVGRYVRCIMSAATTAGPTALTFRVGEAAAQGNDLGVGLAVTAIPPLAAGTAQIGKVLADISPTVANGPTLLVHRLVSAAATTNATCVKTSAGRVVLVRGYCAAVVARYLKLYDKASAPTVGTDTPVLTLYLRPAHEFEIDLNPYGMQFSTGIAYALTHNATDTDSTALISADVLCLNMLYI